MAEAEQESHLKISEVAKRLSCHRNTIERLIKRGLLKAERISPHSIRIKRSSLDEYLASLNQSGFADEDVPRH